MDRFLATPGKPLVLSLSRPVEEKNVRRLLTAYAEDPELRETANLAIVSGSRDDVRTAEEDQRRVFTDLLLDIDAFDLYGKVAIPKKHTREDVPELYRLAKALDPDRPVIDSDGVPPGTARPTLDYRSVQFDEHAIPWGASRGRSCASDSVMSLLASPGRYSTPCR